MSAPDAGADLRRRLEMIVTTVATELVGLDFRDLRDGIAAGLGRVAELLDADTAWLYAVDEDPTYLVLHATWAADGIDPGAGRMDRIPRGSFANASEVLRSGGYLFLRRPEDAGGPEAPERRFMEASGITSAVTIPLGHDDDYVGVLSLRWHGRESTFPDESAALLRLVGELFVGALQRYRAEVALRRLNADLERRVEERTQELRRREEELTHVRTMQAVGRLAAGVAHDFNNVLAIIMGSADLVRRHRSRMSDEAVDQRIAGIEHAARRGVALVNDLMIFSRPRPLQPVVLSVNRLLRAMEPMVLQLVTEAVAVSVRTDCPDDTVRVDRHRLELSVLNLVSNAADAMPDGGQLILSTSCHERAPSDTLLGGRYLALEVTDSGVGMDPQIAAKVFEPFFSTKEPGAGTGLGLANAYDLMRQSGGDIEIVSEPGVGTTVRILLPFVDELAAADDVLDIDPATLGGEETVLVVEDEAALREVMVEILTRAGYEALSAGDVPEAAELAVAQTRPLQGLVTDVVMPGGRGPALAAAIREIHPEVSVLFISGYTEEAAHRRLEADQTVHLLAKPFSELELLRELRAVLDLGATKSRPLV